MVHGHGAPPLPPGASDIGSNWRSAFWRSGRAVPLTVQRNARPAVLASLLWTVSRTARPLLQSCSLAGCPSEPFVRGQPKSCEAGLVRSCGCRGVLVLPPPPQACREASTWRQWAASTSKRPSPTSTLASTTSASTLSTRAGCGSPVSRAAPTRAAASSEASRRARPSERPPRRAPSSSTPRARQQV